MTLNQAGNYWKYFHFLVSGVSHRNTAYFF